MYKISMKRRNLLFSASLFVFAEKSNSKLNTDIFRLQYKTNILHSSTFIIVNTNFRESELISNV